MRQDWPARSLWPIGGAEFPCLQSALQSPTTPSAPTANDHVTRDFSQFQDERGGRVIPAVAAGSEGVTWYRTCHRRAPSYHVV